LGTVKGTTNSGGFYFWLWTNSRFIDFVTTKNSHVGFPSGGVPALPDAGQGLGKD
jgi:hypothetical protein